MTMKWKIAPDYPPTVDSIPDSSFNTGSTTKNCYLFELKDDEEMIWLTGGYKMEDEVFSLRCIGHRLKERGVYRVDETDIGLTEGRVHGWMHT